MDQEMSVDLLGASVHIYVESMLLGIHVLPYLEAFPVVSARQSLVCRLAVVTQSKPQVLLHRPSEEVRVLRNP